MTITESSLVTSVNDIAGIGRLLYQLRTEKGMAIENVARELHLQVRQINALEKGDFSGFSGSVFVKGYLRSFAKLYDVDGDKLIKLYESLSPQQPKNYLPLAITNAEKMVLTSGRSNKKILLILLSLVFLVAAILVFWWRHGLMHLPLIPVGSALDVVNEVSIVTPLAPESAAENIAAPLLVEPPVPIQSADTAITPPDALPVAPQEPQEAQEPILHIEFVDDCWVQLKTDDGKILHEAVHKKGEIFDMPASTPLHVWFGRAAAVNVSYNGAVVAIPNKPGFQSAQFVLGDEVSSGETE